MQKYKIFQIVITREEGNEINSMENPRENHPKYKSYTHAMFRELDQIDPQYYEHVATIYAKDLHEVFEIGNIGPEHAIDRIGRMHSISVGDIIVDMDGVQHFVDRIGFKTVEML